MHHSIESLNARAAVAAAVAACALVAGCTSAPVSAPGAQACVPMSEAQVAALFDRWNASLATGDAKKVVANYAPRSILLPTLSKEPRLTAARQEDYFEHFLHDGPTGHIDQRFISIGCNTAVDAGLYTFTFARTGKSVQARYSYTYAYDGGKWLITSHHSSAMPQ